MNDTKRDSSDVPLPVALGDVVDGKYRVERMLGSGGMGVVVVATHVELGQQVALKFLLPRALKGDEARARFLREARAAVRLKSEHVARVFDVGTLPTGEPYTVMEFLEGSDLASYAKASAPLRVGDAVEFVLQACEAIVEAHAAGIVHRDLKPHNLFVTRRVNGSPLVKVLDFGISKALGPIASGELALTDSTVVLGSPLYMAPEQMKAAKNADARSDIWSLGVILYELLTGRVPFDGESMTELCLKVVNEPPPPPRELRADLPDDVAKVVLRCLEKDPAKRYPNVAKLAEALEGFSTSGQRGGDRTWRSLVDTADAQSFDAVPALATTPPGDSGTERTPEKPAPHARTDVTWGDAKGSSPPRSRDVRRQRLVFMRGLGAGIAVTAVLFVVAFFALRERAPNAPAATASTSTAQSASATASASPSVTASEAHDTAIDATAPSVASVSTPSARSAAHAKPPATHAPSAAPAAPSASATASVAPATTSANGAPILH